VAATGRDDANDHRVLELRTIVAVAVVVAVAVDAVVTERRPSSPGHKLVHFGRIQIRRFDDNGRRRRCEQRPCC
jgi:hypothetical protein